MSVFETRNLHWAPRTCRFNEHLTAIATPTLKGRNPTLLRNLLDNRDNLCLNLRFHDLGRN